MSGHTPDPGVLRSLRARLEAPDDSPGVDLTLEAEVLHALFGASVSEWPAQMRALTFNPTVSIDSAVYLVEAVLPRSSYAVVGPEPGRTCSISPRSPMRPHPVTSKGKRSPAASLVAALLETVARQIEEKS